MCFIKKCLCWPNCLLFSSSKLDCSLNLSMTQLWIYIYWKAGHSSACTPIRLLYSLLNGSGWVWSLNLPPRGLLVLWDDVCVQLVVPSLTLLFACQSQQSTSSDVWFIFFSQWNKWCWLSIVAKCMVRIRIKYGDIWRAMTNLVGKQKMSSCCLTMMIMHLRYLHTIWVWRSSAANIGTNLWKCFVFMCRQSNFWRFLTLSLGLKL